jgi:hypothetical protein
MREARHRELQSGGTVYDCCSQGLRHEETDVDDFRNGEIASIRLSLHPGYQIEPFKDPAVGNTPPVIKFEPKGPTFTGPPKGIVQALSTTMPDPVTQNFWVSDQSGQPGPEGGPGAGRRARPPATVSLNERRGPWRGEILRQPTGTRFQE